MLWLLGVWLGHERCRSWLLGSGGSSLPMELSPLLALNLNLNLNLP